MHLVGPFSEEPSGNWLGSICLYILDKSLIKDVKSEGLQESSYYSHSTQAYDTDGSLDAPCNQISKSLGFEV